MDRPVHLPRLTYNVYKGSLAEGLICGSLFMSNSEPIYS